ncbi:rhodanese-like domain-containing protein [Streptomyces sp. NPDC049040]|uniref:rhodanese-like domain-containing protein n=1 Tax=Streptomyces sp. NPDC049040 TaxID=3365593 RepID=UPI0037247CEC
MTADSLTAAAPAVTSPNAVLRVPPAAPAQAAAYFAASLAFHTDVSDVAAALEDRETGGDPGFVLVDTRSTEAWDQGHIPGAVHLPTGQIPQLADAFLDRAVPVVVHCWGPGCNGAQRAAFALASRGYQVKEMLGGIEYWIREGFGYETASGPVRRDPDALTAPLGSGACGC